MKDDNDNLGDFFRKKMDDYDESAGDWMKPDPAVRDSVLGKITGANSVGIGFGKMLAAASVSLTLVAAGFFIWHLQRQVNELETAVKTEQEKTEFVRDSLAGLSEKLAAEKENLILNKNKKETESEKTTTLLSTDNQLIINTKENEKPEKLTVNKKEKTDAAAKFAGNLKEAENTAKTLPAGSENEKLLAAETGNTVIDSEAKTPEKVLEKLPALPLKVFAMQPTEKPVLFPAEDFVLPKMKRNKTKGNFEIGYEYTLLKMHIPGEKTFGPQRLVSANTGKDDVYIPAQGLTAGWSPLPGLWIRTGFRYASFTHNTENRFGLAYDKSKEFAGPAGQRLNTLKMVGQTPFSEAEGELSIEIPAGAKLEQGDLLELKVEDKLKFAYYQIPLGLDYLHGSGRLKWMVQAGVQWNKVVLESYDFQVWADARGREIPVKKGEKSVQKMPARQFMSAFAGLGLDLELSGKWHARAAYSLQHDFIKQPDMTKLSESEKAGAALKLSLNYRF